MRRTPSPIKTLFFGTPALILGLNSAVAQETTASELEIITIGALRLPTPINETGTSVSVITSDDLDAMGVDFIIDALTLSPGVTVNQNGAFGGQASIRIRGASSEQTLVLVDGIPVNDPTSPGGGFNFARFDSENVERIEILRGPQSTLWGTDAIGGVVAITTKRPSEGLSASGFLEYGSFDTRRGGASGSYGGDIGDIRIAATGMTSDGISKADEANGNDETDKFESGTLSLTGGLNLPSDIRLEGSMLYTRANSEFDSFDFTAQGAVADGDELSETEDFTANLTLRVPLLDGRLENLLTAGYTAIDRRNLTDGEESFSAKGERVILRYQGIFNITDAQRLLFGFERDSSEDDDNDTSINGFFGVYEIEPIDGLTISAGVRHDDHERFGGETTFRAAAAYQVNEGITLRGSWGEGFKAPTIFQTTFFCCGADGPNTDLRPESSKGFDFGVDFIGLNELASLSVTYFNQDVEDQIDFVFGIGGYENIDRVDSQGVEISARFAPTWWAEISADYSFINVTDEDDVALVRVPRHTANLSATLRPIERFSTTFFARYNGSERDSRGTVGDWMRVDWTAQYRFSSALEIYGRVENLFDADYQQILGYGTPGISGSLGVRVRL